MRNLIKKVITPVVLLDICVGSLSVSVYAASVDVKSNNVVMRGY